jgi:hypothetical protein
MRKNGALNIILDWKLFGQGPNCPDLDPTVYYVDSLGSIQSEWIGPWMAGKVFRVQSKYPLNRNLDMDGVALSVFDYSREVVQYNELSASQI